jgi:AcrR family transcriptional regulator
MKSEVSTTRTIRTRTASQQRREAERQGLRQLILQAAGEEFLEHGYDNFSLRRVAERIGYTPTTIYLHFHNKDDLLLATVQEGFQEFDNQMKSVAAAHRDPLARIEALGRAYIDFGLRNPALYRLMFMQRSDFYFMPRFVEAEFAGGPLETASDQQHGGVDVMESERPRTVAMTLLVEAVEEAMAAGVAQAGNAIVAADVLWAGAHGLVSLAISPLMSPDHAQHVVDAMLSTLINGIKAH